MVESENAASPVGDIIRDENMLVGCDGGEACATVTCVPDILTCMNSWRLHFCV